MQTNPSAAEDSPVRSEDAPPNTIYDLPVPLVTPVLIAINVAIFLLMVLRGVPFISPSATDVLPWGASFGPLTTSGQWWRLLTACFLHFGILHIAMNMYILYQVGMFTERLFGRISFLLLYIVAGLGGNIGGLFFHPLTVSAGASGAVFGVYGGLLGFILVERSVLSTQAALRIARSAGIFLFYNLIFGLARPETDLVAHVGGLLTGFASGCLLAQPLSHTGQLQHWFRAGSVALGSALLGALAIHRLPHSSPSQTEWYRATMTGPRVTVRSDDQLVYTGTASRQDAERLAQTLVQVGLFRAPHVVMLFHKTPTSAALSFPLRGDETQPPTSGTPANNLASNPASNSPDRNSVATSPRPPLPWADPVLLASLHSIGPQLASAAGIAPLTIRLLNGTGEVKNEVRIDTTEVRIGAHDRIAYSGRATAGDALALGKALQSAGFLHDLGTLVFLTKASGPPEIFFSMTDGAWNEPRPVAYLEEVSRKIAPSVGGPPLKVHLIDRDRVTRKDLTIE